VKLRCVVLPSPASQARASADGAVGCVCVCVGVGVVLGASWRPEVSALRKAMEDMEARDKLLEQERKSLVEQADFPAQRARGGHRAGRRAAAALPKRVRPSASNSTGGVPSRAPPRPPPSLSPLLLPPLRCCTVQRSQPRTPASVLTVQYCLTKAPCSPRSLLVPLPVKGIG